MKLQCVSWSVLTMSKLYLHTIDDFFLGYFFFSLLPLSCNRLAL